jgi:hypothetical protein
VKDELERIRKEADLVQDTLCLDGLMKTTKDHNQDIQYPSRDLNLRPPEYEALDYDVRWAEVKNA